MSSPSSRKKQKTDSEECIELRKYILACPSVPTESRAVVATLKALAQEEKRIERDLKLKRKFSASTGSSSSASASNESNTEDCVVVNAEETKTNPKNHGCSKEDDELMEWQDVTPTHQNSNQELNSSSQLGIVLSQAAVAIMSTHSTTVQSPIAAVALVLHATLVTPDILQFKCTGIPEPAAPKGFAAPIRELPQTQLVPSRWDANKKAIRLRYRKDTVGSVVLTVMEGEDDSSEIKVDMTPTNTKEPPSTFLQFAVQDHLNLESFEKAVRKEGRVQPALHYKALPVLLTSFCNTFDLGGIQESDGIGTSSVVHQKLPYVDSTVVPPQPNSDPSQFPTTRASPPGNTQYEPPTIHVFQPNRPTRGAFHDDLVPAGLPPDIPGMMGGNLMGPNHPMFTGGIPANGGGYGMRPRFDPFGPPGGPQDPDNLMIPPNNNVPRRRPPPGGPGNPNHDHLRPPSDLGNNMFL